MGYKVCNYVYVILYEMYVWLIVERIVPPDNYIAITGNNEGGAVLNMVFLTTKLTTSNRHICRGGSRICG